MDESEMEMATEILSMLFLLMLAISCGHFLKKSGHQYLQEAGLTTLIGMAAGYMLKTMSIESTLAKITQHFVSLFMMLLLPPIIFESGYNMQKKPFMKNIGSVLMFSFLGTFIAIFFSSIMFFLTGQFGWSYAFSIKDSFAFGSLISATDPVAVLAIFKEMDANENLYAIVFGESIFNDAIGIVMYETVKTMGLDPTQTPSQQVIGAIGKFFLIFIGSVVIGAMTALIASFMQKRQSTYHSSSDKVTERKHGQEEEISTEISMILMCPWVCYLIADGLELSGIVAILTNGIVLNYYGTPNVNEQSRQVIKMTVESLAYTTETMVFIFLGIGVFTFSDKYDKVSVGTLFWALINLNIARYLNVWVTSWICNMYRSEKSKIGGKQKFVMWIAGLRGAMAYALAMESSQNPIFDHGEAGNSGDVMLVVTILYSLFTILGISSILHPIMSYCEVTGSSEAPKEKQRTEDEQELIDKLEKSKT